MDIQTLQQISEVGSKLEKERLLKTVGPDTIKFLKWALDPMITFGVTVDTEAHLDAWRQTSTRMPRADFWKGVDMVCEALASRKLTGNNAVEVVARTAMSAPTQDEAMWFCRILNKDLRSGFSVSTLNKAHPGSIEIEIPCSLAKPYEPEKHEIRGAWCVEPKLDGLRMVVVNGIAYTRNGRTIDSVGHILKELEPYKDLFVFDGEVMGSTDFDQDSGKIRKKGEGPNLSLKYNIFDIVHRQEWNDRKTIPYQLRRQLLDEAFTKAKLKDSKYCVQVPTTLLNDPTSEELFQARDKYIKAGYEGAMLKDASSPYIFKRSDAILKLKEFTDADGRIVDTFEGKGKHKGRLGGFIAEFDGVQTRVGSGFSDAQRDDLWARRKEIVGKMIEVQYQNKTPEGSLRFPVMIRFRPDKD